MYFVYHRSSSTLHQCKAQTKSSRSICQMNAPMGALCHGYLRKENWEVERELIYLSWWSPTQRLPMTHYS